MSIELLIVLVTIAIICLGYAKDSIKWKSDDDTYKANNSTMQPVQQQFDVVGELMSTLREINCVPDYKVFDGYVDVIFVYQGENILIRIENNCRVAKIVDSYWYGFDQSDIEKLSEVRKVINEVNKELVGTTVFYILLDQDKQVAVSSIDRIIITDNPAETRLSLEVALNGIFQAHRCFERGLIERKI